MNNEQKLLGRYFELLGCRITWFIWMLKFYLFIKFASQTNSGSFLCLFVNKLSYFHWIWAQSPSETGDLNSNTSSVTVWPWASYSFSQSICHLIWHQRKEQCLPYRKKVRVKWDNICEMTGPCLRLYMLFAVFPPASKLLPILFPQSRMPLLLSSFHLDNSYF